MLLLISKGGGHVGNGILYGGAEATPSPAEPLRSEMPHTYFVETDFGNHMRLTWNEVNEYFTIGRVYDYGQWKNDRDRKREQPNLIDKLNGYTFVHHPEMMG